MAPLGGSSKFVPVNLNKSYGQPTVTISSPLNRPRLSSSHGGMVLLTRSRSQPLPSTSSSTSSVPARASNKLAVPRPVNLPSLRREHAGNDPTVSLVGGSGSSGWTKQQMSSQPSDIVPDPIAARFATSVAESSWGTPVSQGKGFSAVDDSNKSAEGRVLSHHASFGRSAAYTPPGSRTNGSLNNGQPSPVLVERAVVFRGEDFPTLQAASSSPGMPSEQRQRDLQQRQWSTQNELKEQQKKMQQLSQQQLTRENQEDIPGSQMQPGQPMRPQGKSLLPSSDERRSPTVRWDHESRGNSVSNGLTPLVKLTHTSNWGDDEREALHNFPAQVSDQSEWIVTERSQASHHTIDDWAVDHIGDVDFLRSLSINGSLPGFRRDAGGRNGAYGFKGHYVKDADFNTGRTKENHIDKLEVDSRDPGKWGGALGRNDALKRGWSFPAKEPGYTRDTKLANAGRSSGFNRDAFVAREIGQQRGANVRALRDIDTAPLLDDAVRDISRPEVVFRDGGFRQDIGFSKGAGPTRHGVDGGRGWQGDKLGRNYSNGFQYGGIDSSRLGLNGRQDSSAMDYGRDKRAGILYGHNIVDDPFMGGVLNSRVNLCNGVDGLMGNSGLEARVARRRKDEAQVCEIRDAARESFEAELERVQKLQDQERQRMIEEHNLAMERARKEQEERERLAREEEEQRLKLEQEARELALQAQREVEDTARKVEEERRAREAEKQKIVLEEERRKEAARKKLLELEERIAKRESEKRQEEVLKENVGFLVKAYAEKGSMRNEDLDWEEQDRDLTNFGKAEQEDEERPHLRRELPLQSVKEFLEGQSGRLKLSDLPSQSLDIKGGQPIVMSRTRSLPRWRREKFDNGHSFAPASTKSTFYDDFPLLEQEQDPSLNRLPLRNPSSVESHRRFEVTGRKDQPHSTWERRRASNDRLSSPMKPFPLDVDTLAGDIVDERDWPLRDSHRRTHEGQLSRSPPAPSYLPGTESSDYPSFSRLRQSLPKQPRVPPPPPGRPILHRHTSQTQDAQHAPANVGEGSLEVATSSHEFLSSGEPLEVKNKDVLPLEAQLAKETRPAKYESEENMSMSSESHVSDGDALTDEVPGDGEQGASFVGLSEDLKVPPEGQGLDEERCSYLEDGEVEEPALNSQVLSTESREVLCGSSGYVQMEGKEPSEVVAKESFSEEAGCGKPVVLGVDEFEGFVEEPGKSDFSEVEDETMEVMPEGQGILSLADSEDVSIRNAHVDVKEDYSSAEVHDRISAVDNERLLFVSMSGPVESLQIGPSEALSSTPATVQQFQQQPFSFMAVPIPQATSGNVSALPPILAPPIHGLQNQQEVPFHLQLGLLPGPSLMPNAIQIGSIQMPLHIHPQIPQLAHLHAQQPPMFQFGQISHTTSLSQPVPVLQQQPSTHMHHAAGQSMLPQYHQSQTDLFNPVDLLNGNPAAKAGGPKKVQTNSLASKPNLCSDGAADEEPALSNGARPCVTIEQKGQPLLQNRINPTSAQRGQRMGMEQGGNDSAQSASRIDNGKRRTGGPWNYNSLGRGRGRPHSGKSSGADISIFTAERPQAENRHDGLGRNRTLRRNFRRTEYRVREPIPCFEWETSVTNGHERQQLSLDVSPASGGFVRLDSKESRVGKDAQKEAGLHTSSKTKTGESGRKPLNTSSARLMHLEAKGDHFGIQAGLASNGPSKSSRTKVLSKKYKPDSTADAPLPAGIVCVFEQPGIEIQNDKDDFIEVRSKRQMLREQREQREKENKAKSKDSKVARKHRRVAGVHNDAAGGVSAKNGTGRQPAMSESGSKEGKPTTRSHAIGKGSNLSQNVSTIQMLPIDTSASSLSDGYLAMVSKSPNSSALDSSSNIPAAWGGQRSSQEVVSLTQIQLEEAMKPLRFDVSAAPQKMTLSERVSTSLESGSTMTSALMFENAGTLTNTSILGLENGSLTAVKNPVSFSGPISSLLAGEKIQFGAVTSPTFLSSSSHTASPAPIIRTGSPLGFMPDMSHIYSSHSRSFSGSGVCPPYTSEQKCPGGEDQEEDDILGPASVDPEAEAAAEAAASAVAVAAIGNDDSVSNHPVVTRGVVLGGGASSSGTAFDSMTELSGGLGSLMAQTSTKPSASDDPMSIALPADLSVETVLPLLQGSSASMPTSSAFFLQSLHGGASPFPCLEMGAMLGGPIFTFSPRDDVTLESGIANIGAGGLAGGWPQRHSSTPESFYGPPPSGFTGPFVSHTGLPGIQAHPHMLVYANPFTPVGQFGQLGVGFMGAAYHPSGKQPDWTHTPLPTSSPGMLGMSNGNISVGVNGMMCSQHSSGTPNPVQPVAAPLNAFDASLSASFQITTLENSVQSHWSKAPTPPVNNIPVLGPPPALNVPHQHTNTLITQLGQLPQLLDISGGLHQVPVSMPVTSSSFLSVDAAAQFPDELGLGDTILSNTSVHERLSKRGELSVPLGSKQRVRRQMRNFDSSCEDLPLPTKERLGYQGSLVHHAATQLTDQKTSQQQQGLVPRGGSGGEWSSKKGASGRALGADRAIASERSSGLSTKLKQVYIAKPTGASRKLGATSCS